MLDHPPHRNYYEERLGPGITKRMADWIKTYDPDAVLYLNDYDILTARLDREYVKHIQNFLDQGVPFEGIGVQGHLHAETFNPDSLQLALDMLAHFDLPIRITEFNMPGQRSEYVRRRSQQPPEMTPEEEKQNAQNLVDYYRICFAHPAVNGILMWGFWEVGHWVPETAMWKKDWKPTPQALAYRDLVFKQWWTEVSDTANREGVFETRAFYGDYIITSNGQTKKVALSKKAKQLEVIFD